MFKNLNSNKTNVFVLTVVMLCLVFSITATAKVKPGYSEIPTVGQPSLDPTNTSATEFKSTSLLKKSNINLNVRSSSTLISLAEGSLTLAPTGQFVIYGRTETYNLADQLQYSHDLQKWNGYSWVDIGNYSRNKYNDYSVYGYDFYTPPAGYYRLSCYCFAFDNGNIDARTAYSDYLQIQ